MQRFNPNLLLRDELRYEALLRGVPHEVNTAQLRKSLTTQNQAKLTVDLSNLKTLDLGKEIQTCAAKYYEIQSIAENIDEEENPVAILRALQRIDHIYHRIVNLSQWPETEITKLPESAVKLIETASINLPKLSKSIRRQSEVLSQDVINESLKQLEEERKSDSDSVVEESTRDKPEVSRVTVGEDREKNVGSLSPLHLLEIENNKEVDCKTHLDQGMNKNMSTVSQTRMFEPMQNMGIASIPYNSLYGRITHPIERYVAEIEKTNGLDVEKLLKFLKTLLKIRDIPNVVDCQILEIISVYLENPLASKIMEGVRYNKKIDEVHDTIIKYFIPAGMLQQLITSKVMRPQNVGEVFAQYIADIREYAQILRVKMSESELVQIIVCNLNPEERSRLVLMPLPHSFYDLEQLCIHSSNVCYSDRMRKSEVVRERREPIVNRVNLESRDQRPRFRNSGEGNYDNRNRARVRCFNCGEENHYSRECTKPSQRVNPKN